MSLLGALPLDVRLGEVGLLRCLCARSRWNAELGEPRQLEQIEQALRADDPLFASAVHAADPRVRYKRRGTEAALGFLIGVGLLLAGVVINVILIAVAGLWSCLPAACGR